MPTITAGASQNITLPAGQTINFDPSGSGQAVIANGQEAGTGYRLGGSQVVIGPFTTSRLISVAAVSLVGYFIGAASTPVNALRSPYFDSPALAGDALAAALGPVGISGVTTGNTAKWRAALARMRARQGNARIAVMGDSNSTGYDGSATAARVKAWPLQMARNLRRLLNAESHMAGVFGDQVTPAATYPDYDSRVALGTGWSQANGGLAASAGGLGGNFFQGNSGAAGVFAFTPDIKFDRIRVYVNQFSTGSTGAPLNVDGGATLATISGRANPAARGIVDVVVPGAPAFHTINIGTPAGGSFVLFGIEVWDSTNPSIQVFQFGKHGRRVSDFVEASQPYSALNQLPAMAPDLSLIALQINDANGGIAVDTYTANLLLLAQTAMQTGDVALCLTAAMGSTQGLDGSVNAYFNANRSVASQLGIPVIDMGTRWGVFNEANPLGLWADVNHPTASGYVEVADQYTKGVLAMS